MGVFVNIDGDENQNKCILCSKPFKHYNFIKQSQTTELKEVEIVLAHAACRNLMKKREKLNQALLDVEYDIYTRMFER
jgi:hypothetical protein